MRETRVCRQAFVERIAPSAQQPAETTFCLGRGRVGSRLSDAVTDRTKPIVRRAMSARRLQQANGSTALTAITQAT